MNQGKRAFLDAHVVVDTECEGGLGDDGINAKKILGDRGLTKKVIDEAKSLLKKLRKIEGPVLDAEKVAAEEANFDKAEQELWGWYLEWSAIARDTIKQRSLLLKLGFLRNTGIGDEEVPDNATAAPADDKTP